jgi:hypothetical protein
VSVPGATLVGVSTDLTPAWIGLGGVAVGAVSAQLGNMGVALLGRKDRQAEREQLERERHRAYQRETAIDLQDTLNEWVRDQTSIHTLYAMAYRRDPTMRYGDVRVDEELADRESARLRRLRVLVSRIEDDSARAMVDVAIAHLLDATGTRNADEDEAVRHLANGIHASTQANDRLGEILRAMPIT